MRASGPSGELRVCYQRAAVLRDWTLDQEPAVPRAYTFKASLTQVDPFWITQRPIDLVITVGLTSWHWRDIQPEIDAHTLSVTLRERPIIDSAMVPVVKQERKHR